MCIHFGFAGSQNIPPDSAAYSKINELIGEFLSYSQLYNSTEYGFTGEPIRCNLYSGDLFLTQGIKALISQRDMPLTLVTSTYEHQPAVGPEDHVVALDVKKSNLSYPNITAEYIVNHSDVVFLLWDGTQSFQEGPLWTILQHCKQKHIPYYLINTQRMEDISFSSNSYYVPYSPQFVHDYVKELFKHEVSQEQLPKIRLLKLWESFYDKFVSHHNMDARELPPDPMMKEDYFPADHPSAQNHNTLIRFYQHYNEKAYQASKKYRASIYFRSTLPFWAMVAIAIGTYIEPLGQAIVDIPLWTILASCGFLMHALFNWYANDMSKNKHVDYLRTDFISSRFIAEYLRVLVHGEAYAIQLDNVCMDTPLVDKSVLAKLHHILRTQSQIDYIQTREEMNKAVINFREFIDNQTVYHQNCIKRYRRITKWLSHRSGILLLISMFVVIANSFLQFAVYLSHIEVFSWMLMFPEWGCTLVDAASLLIPACASYFTSKLTMNNFEWLYQNSVDMVEGYKLIQKDLDEIESRNNNSCQIMNDIANDIMRLCQNDFTNWYLRTGAQTFTPL